MQAKVFWVVRRACIPALLALAATAGAATAKVTGIAEVAFFSHDLAAARDFYGTLLGYTETAPGVFQVNARQSIRLIPETDSGTDRLVSISFEIDGATASAATDPDGHALRFVPRRNAAVRAAVNPPVSTESSPYRHNRRIA